MGNWCELCATTTDTLPVLIDDDFETDLCDDCIDTLEQEGISVAILVS